MAIRLWDTIVNHKEHWPFPGGMAKRKLVALVPWMLAQNVGKAHGKLCVVNTGELITSFGTIRRASEMNDAAPRFIDYL